MAQFKDVAQYFAEGLGGQVSTMRLHKFMYLAQAWHLVWDEEKLFDARIEAWANGPMIRDLYELHRGTFTIDASANIGNSNDLTADEKETIDAVLSGYGHLSGQQLSKLTSQTQPWRQARKGVPQGEASTNEITCETMQDFESSMSPADVPSC